MNNEGQSKASDAREEAGGREMPHRVQLSRAKGWRMPPGTVVVSRPSKWGNPFDWREARDEYGCTEWWAKAVAASIYRDWLTMVEPERIHPALRPARVAILANLADLRGKNLACWCPLGSPCHGDVLLELVNGPLTDGAPTRHDETPGDTPGLNNKIQDSVGPGADG